MPPSMNPWTPLVVATFGWACSTVVTKALLNRGLATATLVPLRTGIALATMLVVALAGKRFLTMSAPAWRRGAVLGVVALALPNMLMTRALEDLPVSLGGLLIALIPIATVLAAHFLVAGERFHSTAVPGLLVALAGTAMLVGIGGVTLDGVDNLWRGAALSLLGVSAAGIGGALTRRFAMEVRSEDLVVPQLASSALVLFIAVPLFIGFDFGPLDGTNIALMATLGTVGTALPFAAFVIAASVNRASRLALTGYSVPVLAVALAVIFLGERLTLSVVGGAVLIMAGVILTEKAYGARKTAGTLPPT